LGKRAGRGKQHRIHLYRHSGGYTVSGRRPWGVDIDISTFNMDPSLTEAAVMKKNIKGILPVHVGWNGLRTWGDFYRT